MELVFLNWGKFSMENSHKFKIRGWKGVVMGWVSGNKLWRLLWFNLIVPSSWEMAAKSAFGRILGVARPLVAMLSQLYNLAASKGVSLSCFIGWKMLEFRFFRYFNDRELERIEIFLNVVRPRSIIPSSSDRIVWKRTASSFSIGRN